MVLKSWGTGATAAAWNDLCAISSFEDSSFLVENNKDEIA
jgi:hypothetical protein